jgi:hypothetical protein
MIVDRWIYTVKPGDCRRRLVELFKAEIARGTRHAARIYVPSIGPQINQVVLELEFEDLKDMEEGWAEWFATPGAAEFIRRADELTTEQTFHREMWELVD